MLGRELFCQPPADADIAEVIDDAAEDVPALFLFTQDSILAARYY
jgi:hypothetical protein